MGKKVLVIGSGGREHALVWKLAQSSKVSKIYAAPGNSGTREIAENIPIEPMDFGNLTDFAFINGIDITIIGPESPIASGIVDHFHSEGLKIFGPKRIVELESDKASAKKFMKFHHIPTADFKVFRRSEYEEALNYIRSHGVPIVVKTSGLAAGKGVFVCNTLKEASNVLKTILIDNLFQEAGNEIIIEECLSGQEVSAHAFSDGEHCSLMPISQDHKRLLDGDKGPNTGGMGAYAPVPWANEPIISEILCRIVIPTIRSWADQGHYYVGCLYPGLMITNQGPQVLEYNARFGDPETQVYMPLLETDLLDIIEACIKERLDDIEISWKDGYAICVVLASEGYPNKKSAMVPIRGLEEAKKLPDIQIFHAGTTFKDGTYYASGGRVLNVTALGSSLKEAKEKAYEAIGYIKFKGMQYRKDISDKSIINR